MRAIYLVLIALLPTIVQSQPTTVFEQTNGRQTATYPQIISWWKAMDAASPYVKMMDMGPSDAGEPVRLVLISADKDFSIPSLKAKKRSIILINNGIHPGEPDGIDASMVLAEEIVAGLRSGQTKDGAADTNVFYRGSFVLPSNVVLAIIPVYNIGGCLNRSANYRVDQNGPEEFGFRGNSQNLDLNRDFIKCDSKEALTFTKIFHLLDPDVFADNHVSDGADYQHVMTLITSQHNKLGGRMGEFLNKQFEPALYAMMKTKGYDLVPYVNHFGSTPEKGWSEFWDSPRYSSGYTTLWSTFSFTPETHMLKPYRQRVAATLALMKSFILFTSAHSDEIRGLRAETRTAQATQKDFPIAWKLDRTRSTQITYKGYTAEHRTSAVSGLPRLYYDRTRPFEAKVPFYNEYIDTLRIERPLAYIIPQGWWKVIERLQANQVAMRRFTKDTTVEVEWYRIDSCASSSMQYEGHHRNGRVHISRHTEQVHFRAGDYWIPMNQAGNRFLMETLEPQGEDSYFSWNFFDPVLGQKEEYSDYHFEDIAADYLNAHPEVRAELDKKKAADPEFAKSAGAQLDFVFEHSPYFEPAYLRYPVYRVLR